MIPPGEAFAEKYLAVTTTEAFYNATPEERITAVLAIKTPHDVRFLSSFFENQCKLHSFKQTSENSSIAIFKFKVARYYCNGSGNLHGGAHATIYDVLTSMTMQGIGKPGGWVNGGVSRSLRCTYLRPAPEGIDVLCEVEFMHSGRSLALMRGVMKRADNGKLISTCEHDKAYVPSKPGWDKPKL
ncbi:hypothetical protein CLAFUW4_14016 [Fulvia fulva]|uniref:Thioesterase domain-containing protein n=1 Tax=Passalora fulva TaxID=5499 RepID=A0A9Q8PKX4_PASFU|nr:uncharacterized protein CLAFUR5_13854 [Fulvia fulva]KAK4610198.1 hypothetical protein CLAFUR4_14019 [Fulvia fulva]KAK4611160.1 hypothetical protein CLAFUR0_14023 [Fulvia fulva]UJO24317.1 hypothetical protein CLAFUR5_13854 [Fulvia fulva]WPV21794.1 hypothetical protein CLAFUW4_14016 [Fulvia fulva]WPV36983.1 hypothetical protein CLAFUW7_14025 [Fulvia fulva]